MSGLLKELCGTGVLPHVLHARLTPAKRLRWRLLTRSGPDGAAVGAGQPLRCCMHAWSAEAALRTPEFSDRRVRLLIDLDADDDGAGLRRLAAAWMPGWSRIAIVPDEWQLQRAVRAGLPRDALVLIPPGLEPELRTPARKAAARLRLGLSDHEPVLALLPPIEPGGGAKDALWAGLLAQHLVPELRIVLGDDTRECGRLIRLAEACSQRAVLRHTPAAAELETLLAAADAAICMARRVDSTQAARLAAAAGLPLIVSEGILPNPAGTLLPEGAIRQEARHHQGIRVVTPGDVRGAATLVRALFPASQPGVSPAERAGGELARQDAQPGCAAVPAACGAGAAAGLALSVEQFQAAYAPLYFDP